MLYTFCFILSISLFSLGIILALIQRVKYYASMKHVIAYLLGGTAAALFPLYIIGHFAENNDWLEAFFMSILGVVRSITGEDSVWETKSLLINAFNDLDYILIIYIAFLHVFATILLFGFLLGLLQYFFPRLRYQLIRKGHLCIFSEISERTVLLAEDIRNKEKQGNLKYSVLVFLGTQTIEDERSEFFEQLQKLKAFVFDISIDDPILYKRFRKKEIDIFLLNTNEQENLHFMLTIAERYKNDFYYKKIKIHVLNSKVESETIVDTVETTSHINLRLFKEYRSIFYNLFTNRPLFLGASENDLTILIVGADNKGLEALKIALWCGQTFKLKPKIIIVDRDPNIKAKFEYLCPELIQSSESEHNNEETRMKFFTFDVNSAEFVNLLKENGQINYVICTLDNDVNNMNVAMKIRQVFEETRFINRQTSNYIKPLINVLINDPFVTEIVKKLKFDNRVPCDLYPFGNFREIYTWDNITSSYLDCLGMAFNRFYTKHYANDMLNQGTEEEKAIKLLQVNQEADHSYEDKEYNRSSSMALALHAKYKIYALLCEELNMEIAKEVWTKEISLEILEHYEQALNCQEKGNDRIEKLAKLEHDRWNDFMRSLGWRVANTLQVKSWYMDLNNYRNFAAKLHPCIISWENLIQLDTWFMDNYDLKTNFQELDKLMVKALPKVLYDAICIYNE